MKPIGETCGSVFIFNVCDHLVIDLFAYQPHGRITILTFTDVQQRTDNTEQEEQGIEELPCTEWIILPPSNQLTVKSVY
jgi:hypothetical protein